MKKIPLFVFCVLGLSVYAQQWQWAKKINSISSFDQNCIVADTLGNYYLATSYGCNSGACPIGIIVSKYDNNGLLIWSDNLTMPYQNTYPYYVPRAKLKIKGNYLYLTSQFSNSVFVNDTSIISKGKQDIIIVKYQLNGDIQKVKTIGGIDEDNLNDIYIDNEQNFYLIGSFINSCYFTPDSLTHSKGREDLFVAKYNPNGGLTFFKQAWSLDTSLSFIFTDYVRGANIVVNSQKEIILTGSYNKGLVMDSIIDNYINDDGWKIFILRMDSIGNLTAIYYPPSLYQSSSLSNIFINENDAIFLLQNSWFAHGSVNSINKNNYNGTITSLINTFSSDTEHNNINGFLFDNKENLFYIGSHNSPYGTTPINKFYVAKKDTMNILQWKDSIVNNNAENHNTLTQLALDNLGDIFVIGCFKDTAVFVNDTLISNQNYSWFIAKIIDTVNYNQPVIITASATTTISDFCKVFPNPSSGVITVNSKNKTAEMKICVYDVFGKCVLNNVNIKSNKEKIDLTNLSKGIYTLEIESDGESVMKKIILQ